MGLLRIDDANGSYYDGDRAVDILRPFLTGAESNPTSHRCDTISGVDLESRCEGGVWSVFLRSEPSRSAYGNLLDDTGGDADDAVFDGRLDLSDWESVANYIEGRIDGMLDAQSGANS